MIVAVLEGIVFIAVIASTSLLCGLLRTAKIASQATEEQQLVGTCSTSDEEQSTTREQSKTLRTAS
jgi:outer membrane murein-binding lipoprotein Lpp